MLSVEHVTKRYGTFTALEDVNLAFEPGVYGLLAPNGAGKTTLIKLLATLLFPTEGQILWDGEDIHTLGAVGAKPIRDTPPAGPVPIPGITHLEELCDLGHVAGTGTLAGVRHILTHLHQPGVC